MMELVFSGSSSAGRACALLASYACSFPNGALCPTPCTVTRLGPQVAKALNIKAEDVLCLYAGDLELREASVIFQYIAEHSHASAQLIAPEQKTFERASVLEWVAMCAGANFEVNSCENIRAVQAALDAQTFLCGFYVTAADIAVFASIYAFMSQLSEKELNLHNNVTRWFNHMQNLPGIRGAMPEFSLLPIPTTSAAPILKFTASTGANTKPRQNQQEEGKGAARQQQKEKKEKKKAQPAQDPPADARPVDDVTRLNICVGRVQKVWKHPDAESLYCEEVDLGPLGVRKIASGLVNHMSAEQLNGSLVCVLANLKEKALRGFPSHGMLLCASNKAEGKVELLIAPKDTPLGERVVFEGLTGDADEVLNSKSGKDPFAATQPSFRTDEVCVARFKDHRFTTSNGPIQCASIVGGTIN